MMPHASRRALIDFDSASLSRSRHARIARHLRSCPPCRARLQGLRKLRDDITAATALTAPDRLASIMDRIAGAESVLLPVPPAGGSMAAPGRGRSGSRVVAAAIGLVLLIGGAGLAAAAGVVPLPRFLSERLGSEGAVDAVPGTGGLAVPVPAQGLTIDLVSPHPSLRLRMELTTEPLLSLVGTGQAAAARFRSGSSRIVVEDAGGGSLAVAVPNGGARVRLRIDGVQLLELRDGLLLHRNGTSSSAVDARIEELTTNRPRNRP